MNNKKSNNFLSLVKRKVGIAVAVSTLLFSVTGLVSTTYAD